LEFRIWDFSAIPQSEIRNLCRFVIEWMNPECSSYQITSQPAPPVTRTWVGMGRIKVLGSEQRPDQFRNLVSAAQNLQAHCRPWPVGSEEGSFLGLGWQKLFVQNTKASLQHVQPFFHLTQMTGR
jgi:hypothetical protein